MNAIRHLPPLFAVFLAVAVPGLAADAPAAPKAAVKEEGKGPREAKGPVKPHVLVTISKETTRITEPLRPDGYVDYVAALNQRQSRGVTSGIPGHNTHFGSLRSFRGRPPLLGLSVRPTILSKRSTKELLPNGRPVRPCSRKSRISS